MVAAAQAKGYEYYAITDHAPNLIMQRMTDEKMLAQRDQVRALEADLELLHGTELNIGPDGSVDWDADFLEGFDVGAAQRGWLTPDDVINTWPLDKLRAFLRKDR
jgi:DNA polymerase (family X)